MQCRTWSNASIARSRAPNPPIYSAFPMLLEVLLGKPCLQRHPEVASGAQKQKFRFGCNFFAIRDCCKLLNRGLLPKKAAKMAV